MLTPYGRCRSRVCLFGPESLEMEFLSVEITVPGAVIWKGALDVMHRRNMHPEKPSGQKNIKCSLRAILCDGQPAQWADRCVFLN